MNSRRMEAFSDGVMAIIITIMILEIQVPKGDSLQVLKPLVPVFLSYTLSFINIGIYWNNHHHMMQASENINGKVLWANMHLLFWLSLIPFATGWMGENHYSTWPVALYGIILFMSAIAYTILAFILTHTNLPKQNAKLSTAFGKDSKGKISLAIYAAGVGLSFLRPWIGLAIYALVAALWFIPDRRIEDKILDSKDKITR